MKKLTLFSFTVLFIASCNTTKISATGSYPKTPIIYHSNQPIEKVWDNIIDFFSQKGLSIKIIDKSSGLIISDKSKLSWSFEDKNGRLIDTSAFVVLDKYRPNGTKIVYKPQTVTGEWNIRIKSDGTGTSINVNLTNIRAIYGSAYYSYYSRGTVEPVEVGGKTTGKFEHFVYDIVK